MENTTHKFNIDEDKLKQLPPIDKKTELLLRTLANAILDRIVDDFNSGKLK